MSRITIHLGHYGSGKTEISLNSVYEHINKGNKITLVDLDIVNPYFRSGEHKEQLEKLGVNVIRPNFEGTNVDVPSIPASVMSVFIDKTTHAILDVGGDASGATALGRYHQAIDKDDSCIKCVVNTMRPLTSTVDEIVEMAHQLEKSCRLKIDMLVNNTNLAKETTADLLVSSQDMVAQAAKILGLHVGQIGAMPSVIDNLPASFIAKYSNIITPINLYMRKPWMDI